MIYEAIINIKLHRDLTITEGEQIRVMCLEDGRVVRTDEGIFYCPPQVEVRLRATGYTTRMDASSLNIAFKPV